MAIQNPSYPTHAEISAAMRRARRLRSEAAHRALGALWRRLTQPAGDAGPRRHSAPPCRA